jgi:hypothetical protein
MKAIFITILWIVLLAIFCMIFGNDNRKDK